MINQAFEYLRQFKKVTNETEQLVIKVLKKRYPEISMNELVSIFESGISGDFGKIYNLDPETIIDWVRTYVNRKGEKRSYYETPLLTAEISIYDQRYPEKQEDWNKEVNTIVHNQLLGNCSCNLFDVDFLFKCVEVKQILGSCTFNFDVEATTNDSIGLVVHDGTMKWRAEHHLIE